MVALVVSELAGNLWVAGVLALVGYAITPAGRSS